AVEECPLPTDEAKGRSPGQASPVTERRKASCVLSPALRPDRRDEEHRHEQHEPGTDGYHEHHAPRHRDAGRADGRLESYRQDAAVPPPGWQQAPVPLQDLYWRRKQPRERSSPEFWDILEFVNFSRA